VSSLLQLEVSLHLVLSFCYDGVIVTCYNKSDLTRERKKKGKRKNIYIKYYFSFYVEEDSFLQLEERVKLKLDLTWYYNTMGKTKM
jgi:hypothetical protein